MKKKYVKPEATVVEVEYSGILCASTFDYFSDPTIIEREMEED